MVDYLADYAAALAEESGKATRKMMEMEKKEGLLGLAWLGLRRAGSLLGSAWDGVSEFFEKGVNWLQGEGFATNKEIAVKAALEEFHMMGIEEAKAAALQEYGIQKGKEILDSFYTDSREKTDAKIWVLKQAGYDTTAVEMEVAKRRQAMEERKQKEIKQNGTQQGEEVVIHEAGFSKVLTKVLNLFKGITNGSDNRTVIIEGVQYFSQRDNESKDGVVNGSNMCNLTSLAMVMEYNGIDVGNGTKQYEDRLYEIAKELGLGGDNLWEKTEKVYEGIIEHINKLNSTNYQIIVTNEKREHKQFEDIAKSLINQHKPVITSGYFPNGHIITIVGYDDTGWIAHDPYGDARTKYTNTNGRYVHYNYGEYAIGKKWFAYIK